MVKGREYPGYSKQKGEHSLQMCHRVSEPPPLRLLHSYVMSFHIHGTLLSLPALDLNCEAMKCSILTLLEGKFNRIVQNLSKF